MSDSTKANNAKRKDKKMKNKSEADSTSTPNEKPIQTVASNVKPIQTGGSNEKPILTEKSITKKSKKENLKLLKKEYYKEKISRSVDIGPGDLALMQAITNGKIQDIATILQNENSPCSTACINKSLILSSHRGSKLSVMHLISSGADPNYADEHGNTSLMVCALHGFLDMAKLLIRHKADVSKCNQDGDTALLFALKESGATDMSRLLATKSTVNKKNKNGYSPLMKAIELHDIDTIQMLIAAGASTDDSRNGETILEMANKRGLGKLIELYMESKTKNEPVLICAVKLRDLNLIETLYVSEPNCVNVRNSKGETALTVILQMLKDDKKSMSSKDKNIIQFLLLQGVDININTAIKAKGKKKKKSVESPLFLAVHIDDPDVIRWLCLCGADVNQTSKTEEYTPLMVAAKAGHLKALNALLSAGANIEATCKEGTALDIALTSERIDIAKQLIEAFGKKNSKDAFKLAIERKQLKLLEHLSSKFPLDKDDFSFLILALQIGDLNIIKFLSGLGLTENDNRPLLHGAIKLGKPDLVKALIESNFDVNLKDSVGDTPLHYSCAGDNPDIVRMLLKAGADVNAKNVAGKTAFFVAIERNNPEIVQAVLDKGNT